ncbi:MAG: hypothetical protein JW768_06675 [Chitinispirillaceae bacterium]|nr:hypothetical protein [Chitinispirillaceae bacterium]
MNLKQRHILLTLFAITTMALPSHSDWLDGTFASANYAAAGEYLKLPLHARNAGLEGATVAWQDHHLTGLQYNPAILDAADSMTVIATTSFLTYDRSHYGFDFASGIGEFIVAGLSFSRLGVNNIEGRDEFGVLTEKFGAGFNAISATVAGRLAIPVSLGARGRYIFENIESEHSNGIGFDLGATYRPLRQLCIGASVQNLASYIWWSTSTRDKVLMIGRFGVCATLLDNSLKLELDGIKTLTQPEEAAFAAEYTFAGIISVRAGGRSAVNREDRKAMDPEYSFGAGMRYDFLGFDYALIVPPSELGLIHKISIIGKIPGF